MEHDYFEESPIDGDTTIDAYSKFTVAKNAVLEVKTSETKVDKSENKSPKPIMEKYISDVADFASKLRKDCDPDFLVENAGNKPLSILLILKTKS